MIILLIFLVSCSIPKLIVTGPKNSEKIEPVVTKKVLIKNDKKIVDFFTKLNTRFADFSWDPIDCSHNKYNSVRSSHYGNPIMWTLFERPNFKKTVILLCGVHPDEITPVKFCFDFIDKANQSPAIYQNTRVIVAPIVTTDPFFFKHPTRTNSRKIDINRNFPTKDFKQKALKLWTQKYQSSPRRYPGKNSNSEQETIFQTNLIKLYKPDLIISVHAPLKLLDYDGPVLSQSLKTKNLLETMSKKAGGYKLVDYPFFTGSLGNWAGNERAIPTVTFELPNSDWNKTDAYFKKFSPALIHSIENI